LTRTLGSKPVCTHGRIRIAARSRSSAAVITRWAGPPAPARPPPPGTRSPRACPRGTSRTPTGRSGRGRTC